MGRPKKIQETPMTDEVVLNEEAQEPQEVETVEEETVEVSEKPEERPSVAEEPKTKEEPNNEPKIVGPEVDIKVQNLLRIFNAYDEIYITKTGGVFTKNGLPSHVDGAVLYKNPFYKNVN